MSTRFRKIGNGPISGLLGAFGLGRRARGRGIYDTIKKGLTGAHRFVKDNRLISRGLRHFLPKEQAIANFAERYGYGRGRKRGGGGTGCKFN